MSIEGKKPRRSAEETRELVLEVAGRLFYWNGIHTTGIDRVAAEAGVATAQIYRLFRSKDDLVAAYVERNDAGYRTWVDAALAADGRTPRERLLSLFAAQVEQTRPEICRGCPFLMTLAEYPSAEHPAHERATATKAWVRGRLRDVAAELVVATGGDTGNGLDPDPDELADRLVLVLEGVYATVQALGHEGPARRAVGRVEILLPRR
jgi:AcrR family transcriptional regulator